MQDARCPLLPHRIFISITWQFCVTEIKTDVLKMNLSHERCKVQYWRNQKLFQITNKIEFTKAYLYYTFYSHIRIICTQGGESLDWQKINDNSTLDKPYICMSMSHLTAAKISVLSIIGLWNLQLAGTRCQ